MGTTIIGTIFVLTIAFALFLLFASPFVGFINPMHVVIGFAIAFVAEIGITIVVAKIMDNSRDTADDLTDAEYAAFVSHDMANDNIIKNRLE